MRTVSLYLVFTALCSGVVAADTEITFSGHTLTLRADPYDPFLWVGSLGELRAYYPAVKPFLPRMPFLMADQWVVPGPGDTLRTFPVPPNPERYLAPAFSPNGDYVGLVERDLASSEFPRHSKLIQLMTIQGKLLWQKEKGPLSILVTDDGRVIGRNATDEPLSLVIYAKDGSLIKQLPQLFGPSHISTGRAEMRLVQNKLVLAWEDQELVALNYDGEVLWHYVVPNNTGAEIIRDPDWDPLDRGIYVVSQSLHDFTVDLVNSDTGATTRTLWQNASYSPLHFSPRGRYVVATGGGLRLIDWSSGRVILTKTEDDAGAPLYIPYGDAPSVSDDPPRLASPLRRGMTILDAQGQEVWFLDIQDIGYRRIVLSSDGQDAAILSINSGKPELYGLLLYKVARKP